MSRIRRIFISFILVYNRSPVLKQWLHRVSIVTARQIFVGFFVRILCDAPIEHICS